MDSKAGLSFTVPVSPLPGLCPGEPSRWGMGKSPSQSASASGIQSRWSSPRVVFVVRMGYTRRAAFLCQVDSLQLRGHPSCSWIVALGSGQRPVHLPFASRSLPPASLLIPLTPPIPMLHLGPWKRQDAIFPYPSGGTDSPWICLWPPEPSVAAATCLGWTPQTAPWKHSTATGYPLFRSPKFQRGIPSGGPSSLPGGP